MTPEAHVTTTRGVATYTEYWDLRIGTVFIARTANPNQADLYRTIAQAWNNA